ncbi:MAG: carboxypeptidase regulatory-like domain-containing protein [Muribaculaceae bacterium]|nr:carboxypeptidase regulatory-like domain-containing protein [Muribaculaceae bacterium]
MKKIFLLAVAAIMAAGAMQADTADDLRIYLNPGHGSWGPNDRPMATISYPMLPETGRPDTNGFYESNTNLWKSIQTRAQLIKMGVKAENITMSRWFNGPYPYVQGAEDAEIYNRPLSEICEEVELGNYDMFLSHHSNALTDGTATNYPLMLYRGNDGDGGDLAPGSRAMGLTCWPIFYTNEIDPMTNYSPTSPNVRGDINFYGSSSTRVDPNTGIAYTGYLGVLKHGAPGFLVEGYFHTYQPARHRALNIDYCHQEGIRIARGIGEYFGLTPDSKGYIMGTVKDMHNHLVHNLYNYNAGTMDQWAPINGAVVILYKNGQEVARYTTDDNYNGVFVFENLDPGTYTLAVEAEGFKPLGEYSPADVDSQWKEWIAKAAGNIVVEANKTTYEVALLEDNEYVVPEDLYQNYPEPELPAYVSAPEKLDLVCDEGTEYEFDGKIMRMLVRGDSTVVLTNAEDGTPHLYLINNVDKAIVKELSIDGIAPAEPNNIGFYSRLKDICFTADNQLVGINSLQTQFDAGHVNAGFERGTLRLFKWADFDSNPVEWVTTQSSANFYYYRAQSLAIDGGADDCTVTIAGTNDAASSAGGMRFLKLTIVNNQITSTVYTEKTVNATSNFTRDKVGEPQIVLSPRNDDQVMLDGENTLLMEVATAKANGTDSEIVGRFVGDEIDIPVVGTSFFKYAEHQYMVTPYIAPDRGEAVNVGGIKLYDITAGLDQAALVATTNTDLTPLATQFMATGAAVKGEDINLYLMQDNKITKWQAIANAQPGVPAIYAYGLNYSNDDETCTFAFNANDDAQGAYITFYNADGEEVGTYEIPDVVKGENEFSIAFSELPAMAGETLTWSITLESENINTIHRINPVGPSYSGQLFVAVDKSPCSPKMGTIYAGNRVANNDPGNGVYLYDANGIRMNDQFYNGNRTWRSLYRMGIDCNGKLYVPDWGDPTSGVFIADPNKLDETWNNFFVGERNSDGLITNNGVAVGSSTPGVGIGGKGADTKLYVYLEDFGNGVGVYNIGQPDGSIVDTWTTAPNQYFDIGAWQLNTNGNVVPDPAGHGVWVSQYRSAGNNASGVPSLMFVDNDGNVTFNSGRAPYNEMLNGSDRAGFTVNEASDLLVINDGSYVLQFFDITWNGNTPDITPKYSFKTGQGSIYQMAFDYAGNLVCAGGNIGIYSLPTQENICTTPACGEFKVIKIPTTGVDEVKAEKTLVRERYYDIRGIEYSQPVEGVNIIVRTYSDGSTQSVKVIK